MSKLLTAAEARAMSDASDGKRQMATNEFNQICGLIQREAAVGGQSIHFQKFGYGHPQLLKSQSTWPREKQIVFEELKSLGFYVGFGEPREVFLEVRW